MSSTVRNQQQYVDLPGGRKRIAEEVDFIYDRDGLYACQLDFTRREDFDYDIADAIVRVLRKPLLGPTETSTLPVSNASDDKGHDHNAGKRKRPEFSQGNDEDKEEKLREEGDEDEEGDDDDEVQFVKQMKK